MVIAKQTAALHHPANHLLALLLAGAATAAVAGALVEVLEEEPRMTVMKISVNAAPALAALQMEIEKISATNSTAPDNVLRQLLLLLSHREREKHFLPVELAEPTSPPSN